MDVNRRISCKRTQGFILPHTSVMTYLWSLPTEEIDSFRNCFEKSLL